MTPTERLRSLGRAIATEEAGWADPAGLAQVRHEFLERLPDVRRGRLSRRLTVALAAAAVMVAASLVFGLPLGEARRLTMSVRGAEIIEPTAKWWSVEQGQSVPVSFSDGSLVNLVSGTRARVTRVSAVGAELIVESGKAQVHVVPRKNASWKFNLGPYVVNVLGTHFDVAWQPEADTFELTLYTGTVQISGCIFGEGRPVVAGERVRAFCGARRLETTLVGKLASQAGTQARNGVAPSSVRDEPRQAQSPGEELLPSEKVALRGAVGGVPTSLRRSTVAAEPAVRGGGAEQAQLAQHQVSSLVTPESWQSLASKRDYPAALKAAEDIGFESECSRLDARGLMQLADVARYAGKTPRAVYAYKSLRGRFSGSDQAAIAAYFLARIAFDQLGDYAQAAGWFKTYLSENPTSGLRREALGRLMEAQHRSGSQSEASGAARRYLAEYPSGPGAPLARQLISP